MSGALHRPAPMLRAALALVLVALGVSVAAPADDGWPAIRLEPVLDGFTQPVYLTHAGDASGRHFVVEQPGRIRVVDGGRVVEAPFLDIRRKVLSGGERGLLGLAFHPRYRDVGRYFVNYTRRPDGATVIAEYRMSENPLVSAPAERVLLVIPQPYANHNGGMVAFGPDGFLYIGMGDGGSGGDPGNRAQNRDELLGKMLRIDVNRGEPYAVPEDNPFASGGGRPEIYAVGLRNPWRFSFDRADGTLWVADVGQNRREEIHHVRRGGNYGWRIMEGTLCFSPRSGCDRSGLELPIAEYATGEAGRCAIVGGYVYRGRRSPALEGMYLFADYCSGELFALRRDDAGRWTSKVVTSTGMQITSLGEDAGGEVYALGHGGTVHRIVATAPEGRERRRSDR